MDRGLDSGSSSRPEGTIDNGQGGSFLAECDPLRDPHRLWRSGMNAAEAQDPGRNRIRHSSLVIGYESSQIHVIK
jgi:hypothetical protein